jgi:CTP:molybdopterin cytidylyltransferase MocA
MNKNLTLLVLAAGMGSRFGGLKQIEPVGPNGEFIIDYSIYDAIRAGFNKVVFVIKEENYEIFKSTIGIILVKKDNKVIMEYCSDKRILSKEYILI